jgi:hypothetical protein
MLFQAKKIIADVSQTTINQSKLSIQRNTHTTFGGVHGGYYGIQHEKIACKIFAIIALSTK